MPVLAAAAIFFIAGTGILEDIGEDWPLFALFAALFALRMAAGRKRRPGPGTDAPDESAPRGEETAEDIGFRIPPIQGAPRAEEAPAPARPEAEERPEAYCCPQTYLRYMEEKDARKERAAAEQEAPRAAERPPGEAKPSAAPSLREAVIFAEILAPPKALRRGRRG